MPPPSPEPLVQVLLPFFRDDPARFREALESVAAQTLPRWECLLLSDGADAGLLEQARAFQARDPRFRLLEFPHRGLAAALNAGLHLSGAPYLARMDADDRSAPERLGRQVRLAATLSPPFLLGCGVRLSGGMHRFEEWLARTDTRERILQEAFVDCPLPHPTWLARREDLLALGGYRVGDVPEDYDLFLKMVAAGWDFRKAEGPLYTLNHHAARLTVTDPRYRAAAFRRIKWEHLAPRLASSPISIIGGGSTARAWLDLLRAEGIPVDRLMDIRPTRVGKIIRGVPVEDFRAGDLPRPTFPLVAVPRLEQRDDVRRRLTARGRRELHDFLCVT